MDLSVDPPPDLAIEIDITSRTHTNIYTALNVPELWRFKDGKLQIDVLRDGEYVEVEQSPNFPGIPLKEMIPYYLEESRILGRNAVMKAFRRWIQEQRKGDG